MELLTQEYQTFQANAGPAPSLYVDQFTLIAYYIQTHDWKWKFRRHLREPDRVDEYDLTSSTGQHLVVLRNIDRWNFDLSKPEIYQVLVRSLHDAQLTSANMFLVKQVHGHADSSANCGKRQSNAKTCCGRRAAGDLAVSRQHSSKYHIHPRFPVNGPNQSHALAAKPRGKVEAR